MKTEAKQELPSEEDDRRAFRRAAGATAGGDAAAGASRAGRGKRDWDHRRHRGGRRGEPSPERRRERAPRRGPDHDPREDRAATRRRTAKPEPPARRGRGYVHSVGRGNDGHHEAGSDGGAARDGDTDARTRPWKAGGDSAPFLVTMRGLSWETRTSHAEEAIRDRLTGVLEPDAIKIYKKGGLNTGYLKIRFPTTEAAAAGARTLHKLIIGRRWLEVVDAPGWEGAAASSGHEAAGGMGPPPPGLPPPVAEADGRTRATGTAAGSGTGGSHRGHEPGRSRGDGHRRGGRLALAAGRDEHPGPCLALALAAGRDEHPGRIRGDTGRRGEPGQALSKREIRREGRRLARYLTGIQETTDRLVAAAIFSQGLRGKPPPREVGRESDDSSGGSSYLSNSDDDGDQDE